MAKKGKRKDRALILLLLALALVAFLYNQGYMSGGTGPGTPNSTPDGDKCCCADPFAYIYQLPGGECQCLSCTDANPNMLFIEGSVCCTSNVCSGDIL
jgi:hypothetical protein